MSTITRVKAANPEKTNLIFTGYMGAGKTSVGEACAALSSARLVDTDELIEQKTGMTINHIFEKEGEEAFRDMETDIIKQLLTDCDNCVISVGGGLPLRGENRELLSRLGTVIFLRVKRDTVLERLQGDTTRPNLNGDDLARKADEALAARNPLYLDCADWVIDTDEYTPQEIAMAVMDAAGWPYDKALMIEKA